MRIYPHDANGRVAETWEARKWLWDAPNNLLTPMFRKDDQQYFVNELVECKDRTLFIPERIFTRSEEQTGDLIIWCLGREVYASQVAKIYSFL